jgi:hypothetical protein
VKHLDADRMTFDMQVDVDGQIDFQQQIWERNVRLYSGSTQARAKFRVLLRCEMTTRVETGSGPLPDFIFRLRVTDANVSYHDLDVVHIAGLGGDGAKVVGDTLHTFMNIIKPTLEKDALEHANSAIVKAGDTKEVRVSLSKLLSAGDVKK